MDSKESVIFYPYTFQTWEMAHETDRTAGKVLVQGLPASPSPHLTISNTVTPLVRVLCRGVGDVSRSLARKGDLR
jgi:hypothetical protein